MAPASQIALRIKEWKSYFQEKEIWTSFLLILPWVVLKYWLWTISLAVLTFHFILIWERDERRMEKKFPSTSSLPKYSKQPGLVKVKARSPECNLDFLNVQQRPNYLTHHLMPPILHIAESCSQKWSWNVTADMMHRLNCSTKHPPQPP